MDLSPDVRTIAVGREHGVLGLSDDDTGQPLGSPRVSSGKLSSIVFRPDGRLLATSGSDGRAQLWDVNSVAPRGEPMPLAARASGAIAFQPDGRSILTAGSDSAVQQ
jgi:WD40 repeat protein